MTELNQAEEAFAQATARAQELSAMGSLELHAAVTGGPSQAAALLSYHRRLRAANDVRTIAYMRVRDLHAAQGLPPLEGPFTLIGPDYGPMPTAPPGTNIITGRESTWIRLLGSLNGGDLDQIAKCLGELDGWIFGG